MQTFIAEQLRRLGISGTNRGHLVLEPDGDPNPGVELRMIQDNRTATTDPGISDDQTQGYTPGSLWINTTAGDEGIWWCAKAATGGAIWRKVGSLAGGDLDPGEVNTIINLAKIEPGEHTLGLPTDYHATGGVTADEIQYCRIWLLAGMVIDRQVTYIFSGANGVRNYRLGLYDQADPTDDAGLQDPTLPPRNRVAQTNIIIPAAILNGNRIQSPLTNAPTGGSGTPISYTVPASGYYWLAHVTNNTAFSWGETSIYSPNFLPVRREAGPGANTLPASAALILTNPASAVVFCAALEQ